MGRNKKYFTVEEKRDAKNKTFMRYYERNKEQIKIKNLKRYHEKINHK